MKFSKSLIVGLMAMVLFFGRTQAQSIEFNHGTIAEVLQQAKTSGKLVFVDCYTDWCGPCKYMAANTFTDPAVASMFNAQFINYKLDMEKGEGVDFAKKYAIRAFPTLLFLDGEGNMVHAAVGGLDPEGFMALGKDANDPSKQLSGFIKSYQDGNRDVDFLTQFILKAGTSVQEAYDAVSEWHKLVKPAEMLANKDYWDVFMYNFRRIDTDFFLYVVAHQEQFSQRYTREMVEMKLANNFAGNLYEAKEKNDQERVDLVTKEFIAACGDVARAQLTKMDMYAAMEKKDVKTYCEKAIIVAETYAWDDAATLNNIVWGYYDMVDAKKDLKRAEKWIKRSIELEESYFNIDTYGMLLTKMGDTKGAIAMLEKAIEFAKASGESYEETQAELDKLTQ